MYYLPAFVCAAKLGSIVSQPSWVLDCKYGYVCC
jgi:hypothetical protein